MKRVRVLAPLFSVIAVYVSSLSAQVLDVVDVHLTVKEKVVDQFRALPGAKLAISDVGEVTTDQLGQYRLRYPIRQSVEPIISISLLSDQHQLLKPMDGTLQLDAERKEIYLEFLVVNLGEETPEFRKRVSDLESTISSLRRKNQLTIRQLNELNSTLLDTIMYYEANRQQLESRISQLEVLTAEQRSEMDRLRHQIGTLEQQVDHLTNELEKALEERYLRQNQHYRDISSNLLAYIRKAKDIRDHMPFISAYHNSPSGYGDFDKDIKAYNAIWESFDNHRMSYLKGVQHYWSSAKVSRDLEELFDQVVQVIHQKQMLGVVRDINAELHKQSPRKAQKVATMAYDDMGANLLALERQINRVLSTMRNDI